MKKEITEYEPAEDTITKIKCGSCEQTWDSRGVRGKQGVNTVVLDGVVQRKRHRGWSDERLRKWNGSSVLSSYPVRISGEAVEDYCHSCWDAKFTEGPAAEIEEPEYYVEEETRHEYYCDFCGSEMGDEPDHEVTVNPRLEVEEKIRKGMGLPEQKTRVATREIEDQIHCGSYDRIYAKRDDNYDCCRKCATDIFNLGITRSNSSSNGGGIIHGVASATTDMCVQIKDILLFNRV